MARIDVQPVTPKRWDDVADLFTRQALEEEIRSGRATALLAYADGEPIGWCRVGPRRALNPS